MNYTFTLMIISLLISPLRAGENWETFYEQSAFTQTPSYAQTVDYARRLAQASPWVTYRSFGVSPQGRALPLLIVDRDGLSDPQAIRRAGRVIMLIQAGIHAGEIDGKDAGLMLIRDLAIKRQNSALLDKVSLLFMPIFNVDGHERFGPYNRINQNGPQKMGWRTTAQNYNLNRDYLKADAPEMQSWLRLYHQWKPEFFIDCHVTDGADYQYALAYAIDEHGLAGRQVNAWVREQFVPHMRRAMRELGFPTIDYIQFRQRHRPRSGLVGWVAGPRFSNGYTAYNNRPGLLIETHMLKPYRVRVEATHALLLTSLRLLAQKGSQLQKAIAAADSFVSSDAFRQKPYPLSYRLTGDSSLVTFLGKKYRLERSAVSGAHYVRFSEDTVRWRIPFFNTFRPATTVGIPLAYILPPEWSAIAERMALHGLHFRRLNRPLPLAVESYRFANPVWRQKPFENHHRLRVDKQVIREERHFPAGSYIFPTAQPGVKLLAHMMEPDGSDSFVQWGFFDPVFEQKEYAENYVMELLAPMMLAGDAELKKRFERKRREEPAFAADPRAILEWFYRQSPWFDQKMNLYPVGRIYDKDTFNQAIQGSTVR